MGARRRVEWAIEVASLAACAALISEGQATIHGGSFAAGGTVVAVGVLRSDIAALVPRTVPSRLAPLLFMVLLPGLLASGSARVSVWTFAFAALFPLALV